MTTARPTPDPTRAALEALVDVASAMLASTEPSHDLDWDALSDAIDAARAALAQPTPPATGTVERECVCSVRADDCGLPCPCWHHTPPATGTVERCGWCGGSGRITSGSAVCPTCHGTGKSAPTPAPEPSAALVEADDALRTLLTLSALLVSVIDSGEVLSDHDRATIRAARGKARAARRSLAAARAEGLDVGALREAMVSLGWSGGRVMWVESDAVALAAAYRTAIAARARRTGEGS